MPRSGLARSDPGSPRQKSSTARLLHQTNQQVKLLHFDKRTTDTFFLIFMNLLIQHLPSPLFEPSLCLHIVELYLAHAKCAIQESLAHESKILFVSATCTDDSASLQAQNTLTCYQLPVSVIQ